MDEEDSELSPEETVLKRHRAEVKELNVKILQLKKSVNKDKKRKREVQDEIAVLEKNLKERHEAELVQIKAEHEDKPETLVNGVESLKINDADCDNQDGINEFYKNTTKDDDGKFADTNKKISKAEKRRQKKALAQKEREAEIKEAEKLNKYSARNVEAEKIKKLLKERGLKMYEINPDGNCLYAAVAHQLGSEASVQDLRAKAASYIRAHSEDFLPFITDPKTGESLNLDEFENYCNQLETTATWGGQPELRALSQSLKTRIEVVQAEGSEIMFGEEFVSSKRLLLAYYRHYYGLGEHYNSVIQLKSNQTEGL